MFVISFKKNSTEKHFAVILFYFCIVIFVIIFCLLLSLSVCCRHCLSAVVIVCLLSSLSVCCCHCLSAVVIVCLLLSLSVCCHHCKSAVVIVIFLVKFLLVFKGQEKKKFVKGYFPLSFYCQILVSV